MIDTNFAGWPSSSIDMVERDSKSLRATLTDERRRTDETGGRVSTKFIAEQKDKFRCLPVHTPGPKSEKVRFLLAEHAPPKCYVNLCPHTLTRKNVLTSSGHPVVVL